MKLKFDFVHFGSITKGTLPMNKTSPFLRRYLLLLPLALMVASDCTAQEFDQRIVFASNRDGDWDIYSMDVNGDNLLQLTDHPASDEYPACSPDGRRIAFTSERGVTHDLYVMDSNGNDVIRLPMTTVMKAAPVGGPMARGLRLGRSVLSLATRKSTRWTPMEKPMEKMR